MDNLISRHLWCEDTVPRASVEYICRKNTVSTNPYEHEYHDKFIQFMNDPEISDFGRWQFSNGFNMALIAVECDLDKVPSVTPKQPVEDIKEYYELILRHRIQDGSRQDPYIEEPVVVKGFTGPFKSDEHDELLDDMYRKLKEYWLTKREEKDGGNT